MAATGSGDFDQSVIKVGAQREAIEKELGQPQTFYRQHHGDVATYQVLTGDKGDYGRAATYALLDGITLGFAELVSFPTEALQGDQHIFDITYDAWGRAKKIESFFKKAPAPNPTELVEEQLKEDQGEGA